MGLSTEANLPPNRWMSVIFRSPPSLSEFREHSRTGLMALAQRLLWRGDDLA
jgi:hypothetical protein